MNTCSRHRWRIAAALACSTGLYLSSASAQTAAEPNFPANDSVVRHIYLEGMQHSHAMALAQVLLDSIGPRLTGSPANRAANAWLVQTYTQWGIPARNEQYGTWRTWTRGVTHLDLVAPRVRTLEGTALAWSAATPPGGVTGDVVVLPAASDTKDAAGFTQWLTTVRGKFVLLSAPQLSCRPESSWKHYALPDAYQAMTAARDSAQAEWQTRSAVGDHGAPLRTRLAQAGVAGILTSAWTSGWGTDMIMDTHVAGVPVFDLSCEDYSALARLAEHDQHPRLHAVAEAQLAPAETPVYNTIAELKGTEHPEQYVVLSAHVDSWDTGSGATDNGMGTIVMLEAMRLLKQFYPHPKRTILVGHWSGEEEGEIGSNSFVADHPALLPQIQALFNTDDGMGRIAHMSSIGLAEGPAALARWMAPIPTALTDGIQYRDPGAAQDQSTDSDAFACRDAPAFDVDQVGWDGTYTYHSNRDTFDKLSADDLRRNATLIALLAYEASEDPHSLARPSKPRYPCLPVLRSWQATR